MSALRGPLIWLGFTLAVTGPMVTAMQSPLLAWREPIYILSGFAGVAALGLLFLQPLLILGVLPGLSRRRARRLHPWIGSILVFAVIVHVAGLWITSPPDVIDALLFVSATWFSLRGVIAMWMVFGAAMLAAMRRRLKIKPATWRKAHIGLTLMIVVATLAHTLPIQGTMQIQSKYGLCFLVFVAAITAAIASYPKSAGRR